MICNGFQEGAISRIINGKKVGTFFTKHETTMVPLESLAVNAKHGEYHFFNVTSLEAG